MESHKKIRGFGYAVLAALAVAGCMQDPVTSSRAEARAVNTHEDPNIALLVASGIPESDISLQVSATSLQASVSVDAKTAVSLDTSYIIEKAVSEADKKKGYASVRVAYRKKTLDKIRLRASSEDNSTGYSKEIGEKVILPRPASAPAAKSSQARWDHNTALWDIKALTEVHQIKVYIQQTGATRLGVNWIAGARQAMTNWNNATGTHVSFVETSNVNDCDLILKGAFSGSGGSTTWLTPDPWVEKDSVEIYFNTGFETVFPHNQKVAFAMVSLGNILNIVHTNAEGATWNGGTFVNVAGTYNESASLFQTSIGPSVNPVFSTWDLKTIRQIYPINGSAAIYSSGLWTAGWEANVQIASNVSAFTQIGDTLIYRTNSLNTLYMRVGTTSSSVQIHPASLSWNVSAFQANGSHIMVRRSNGEVWSRTLAGTASGATWDYKMNIGAGTAFRLSGNQFVYVTYAPGYPVIYGYNLSTNTFWWEWSGAPGQTVNDFQLQGSRLIFAVDGTVWEKDLWTANLQIAWDGPANGGYANRIRLSDSYIAIHMSPDWNPSDGTVLTRPLWGGNWDYFWNEVNDPDQFDLCGDKVGIIGQGYYLMLKNLSTTVIYNPWSSINGAAYTVRLSGPMCDYVTKADQYSNSVMTKYSITNATDYFQYQNVGTNGKLEQRP